MHDEKQFQARIQQIEGLIQGIESGADPAMRARMQDLLQLVLEWHGAGLERMLDLAAEAGGPGLAIIDGFTRDELVSSLLLLHDLHPLAVEARGGQALDTLRPELASQGACAAVLYVSDGVARVQLAASGHGCGSSDMTLRQRVEAAVLAAAPDLTSVAIEGLLPEPPPGIAFVPLTELRVSPSRSVVLPLSSNVGEGAGG